MESHMYSGYGPPSSHMYQGPSPAMFFNHKAEKIDWRRIAAVDLNRISKELDFTALQDTISNIAFCDIEHELDARYIEPNYVRLFKLAQLQIQYLLYSQDYLTGSLSSEAEKGQAAIDELEKVRRDLAALRDRQIELKKQCHRYKKMVRIQQMLMPSSHDLHHPCPHCDKKFISRDFLANHLERRHQNANNVHSAPPVFNLSHSNSKDVEELREQLKLKSTEIDLLRQQMLQGGSSSVGGNIDLSGLRQDMMMQHKEEMDGLKNMFMEELKDLNSRYMASEKALQEMRVKQNQGSRSNLGELEDDDEAQKLQREQDQRLAEENRKLKADIAREKAISEKRKIDIDKQRAEFENRMMEARENRISNPIIVNSGEIHASEVLEEFDEILADPLPVKLEQSKMEFSKNTTQYSSLKTSETQTLPMAESETSNLACKPVEVTKLEKCCSDIRECSTILSRENSNSDHKQRRSLVSYTTDSISISPKRPQQLSDSSTNTVQVMKKHKTVSTMSLDVPVKHSTPKQRKQVENENLSKKRRQSDESRKDEELIDRRTAALAAASAARSGHLQQQQQQSIPSKFQPEDSDETTEDESESILVSKEMKKTLADTGPMGTGEMSATSSWDISQLRSSRVMEKLKAEPKLLQGFISELRMILEERLMELGVDKAAKRLTTPVLNEKLAILRKERDQLARKHVRFAAIRQQYVREVEKDAQERLRGSPQPMEIDNRVRSQSATVSPGMQRKVGGPRPPPRPSPQADRRSASLPIPSSPNENRPQPSAPPVPALKQTDFESESETDESYSAFGDDTNIQPQSLTNGFQPSAPPVNDLENDVRPSPRKPRQHRPLSASNGINKLDSPESGLDWDTTDGRKLSQQARGTDIVIPSRTVKKEEEYDDWDDDYDDEIEQLEKEVQGNHNMEFLRQSLEQQMQRPRDSKPVGGISLFPHRSSHDEDDPIADILDDEDDAFDVSSLIGDDSRPPSRKISGNGHDRGMFGVRASVGSSGGAGGQNSSPSGQLRLSNAGTDLSNTFGTSQWGTTSKVVSTVNPGATQKSMATNKSSDVGGDDDFDSD